MNRKDVLKSMMTKMGTAITGCPIVILDMKETEGLAASVVENGKSYIKIAFDKEFPDVTPEQKEILLFGLFAHELLHILLSDFEFVGREIVLYPEKERRLRLYINNLVEDPAIEYFGDQYLSDFLMSALRETIGYFYNASEMLGDKNVSAFDQLMHALIQYGDIGVIRGKFTFPEARDAFIQIVPIMSDAIEEPDPKQRFYKAQKIYDILEPLWKEHEKELLSNLKLDEVFKQYGKNVGMDAGDALAQPESDPDAQNAVSDRRKKTVHLITKRQAEELKKNMPESETDDLDEATDIFIVIDDENDEQEEQSDSSGIAGTGGMDGQAESDKKKEEASIELPATAPKMDQRTDKDAEDFADSSGNVSDIKDAMTDSENTVTDETLDKPKSLQELLGEEIEEIAEELSSEISAEIPKELMELVSEMIEQAVQAMKREQCNERKHADAEDLYVDVKSSYYSKTPCYQASKVRKYEASELEYDSLCREMKTYILNLKSELRKIFQAPNRKTEYRTSGRLDTGRACGKKISARLFKKRNAPDDKADLGILVLLDASGSMNNKVHMVKLCCTLLQEAFSAFKVHFKVIDFTSEGNYDASYKHYGSWDNTLEDRKCITTYHAGGGTFLGHAIRYGGNLLKKRPEQHKIYIVITDGDPSSSMYKQRNDGMNDCRSAVKEISQFADVIGIGVYGDESEKKKFEFVFQESFVSFRDITTLVQELPKKLKRIIRNY